MRDDLSASPWHKKFEAGLFVPCEHDADTDGFDHIL